MKRFGFLFAYLIFSLAVAQLAVGSDPVKVAEEAIQSWLEQPAFNPADILSKPQDEICTQLSAYLFNPPPPSGTNVNLEDRQEIKSETATEKTYTYPASFSSGQLAIVEVKLEEQEGQWQASSVKFRLDSSGTAALSRLYDTIQQPFAYILFSLFSLGLIYLLLRPSFLRRQLAEGWGYIKEHRRLVWFTIIFLYGLFALGFVAGRGLSETCAQLFLSFFQNSLDEIGAGDAASSLNVARLATLIFFQNFTFGVMVTTFGLAVLFGIPAFLMNGARYYLLGIPFGYQGFAGVLDFFLTIILFIVELMAYILVTAGGGMLLVSLIRQGFKGLNLGFRKLVMMLPIAMLLLVIGAWYEAVVIMLAQRLTGP